MKTQNICGARTKGTGNPCQRSPMPNGKCYLHGGASTGRPVTTGAGTKQALADRAKRVEFRKLLTSIREMVKSVRGW